MSIAWPEIHFKNDLDDLQESFIRFYDSFSFYTQYVPVFGNMLPWITHSKCTFPASY